MVCFLVLWRAKGPEGFIWGASTSAYQIEGGYKDDEKGESIWDRFTHTSGKMFNNDTGDVACDHYHLYKNDVKFKRELGLKSYSFTISWPRIFRTAEGNQIKRVSIFIGIWLSC